MDLKIYHNPRCSKSRQTLEILQKGDKQPIIIEYLKSPPTHQELDSILRGLEMEPRELMRKREEPYKQLALDDPNLDRNQLINAMIENPILIERPIVVNGDQVVIGRPPEAVLGILS